MSMVPMHAMTSEISWPSINFGSACKLMNDGPRKCTRSGFGEPSLVIAGSLLFSLSLVISPFVRPATGLFGILSICALSAVGNALSAPSLTSLASKSATAGEQGAVLGVAQSVASLARAAGPSIAAFMIYSAVAHMGFDRHAQNMSDASILRTFWTAAAIQIVAFLLALYFARVHGSKYSSSELAEAA